jgi:cytochrome P450
MYLYVNIQERIFGFYRNPGSRRSFLSRTFRGFSPILNVTDPVLVQKILYDDSLAIFPARQTRTMNDESDYFRLGMPLLNGKVWKLSRKALIASITPKAIRDVRQPLKLKTQ